MEHTRGKSTGPKSPQGKQRSSMNSTTHGMRSNVVKLLADESQEEMDAMRAMWQSQYGCYAEGNPAMDLLLLTLGDADWMQRRGMRLVSGLMAELMEAEASGADEERTGKLEKRLGLWTRYKTQWENSFQRALRAVEQFLGRRRRESMQQQKIVVTMRDTADRIGSRQSRDGRVPPVQAGTEQAVIPSGREPDSGGGGVEKRT